MAFCEASPSLPEQAQPPPPPFTTPSQSSEQLGSNSKNNMNRRIWGVQQSTQSSPVDSASLSSRGSMHLDGVGGSSTTTASQHTASSSCASVGSNFESSLPAGPGFVNYSFEGNASNAYGYYLDRGNGQFTRLIPADTLPPLTGVPARQERHDRMVVLKPIENLHPQNAGDYLQVAVPKHSPMTDNLQNQIDCIVATSPKSNRRVKIYCDKWIHEGVCAFTQQGCKFKHEMPQDEATQRSLGLFHGFPAWWKKHVEEQNVPRRVLDTPPPSSSPGFLGTATTPHLGSSEVLRARSHPLTPPTVFEPQLAQQQQQQYQRSLPLRDSLHTPNSFAPGPTNWRASGSQWMQNGIVPFVRGPRRAY